MKLTSVFVLGVMAVAMGASAQAQTTDPIAKALLAAPSAALAKDATVVKWNPDFTWTVLKQGTNRMVCYDLSGMPGERPWSTECTSSDANLPRIAQNRKFAAMAGGDSKKIDELVYAAAVEGTRIMPEIGSMWYNFRGNTEDTATRHTQVAMPNIRGQQVGLPENRDDGGAWVMFAGSPEGHIMIPGR